MAAEKSVIIGNCFVLKLGGAENDALFESVSGLSSNIEYARHNFVENNGDPSNVPSVGNPSFGSITISRGFDKGKALWDWHMQCATKNDPASRKDCTLEVQDDAGKALATFNLVQCWPSSYQASGANAGGGDHFFETVSFELERWDRK
jgi:phage tail-like protein